ncbi:pre-mRNA 3' end processing protein WDR33-like [Ornithodoros turicata]|uniref:pre-mRNA 3' end processing protein WDR33-like n=1 Tax=Ornithodoros turicata TaxID=34597 RepID=UPI0031395F6C
MQVIQTQNIPMAPRFQYQGGSPGGIGSNKFSPGGYGKMSMGAFRPGVQQMQSIEFDGKRLRKAVARKTVDYNTSIVEYLETRVWQRDYRDARAIQPDSGYYTRLVPPLAMLQNPINAVTTKFVRTSTNKMRCPIFCVVWTPEGRRLITGASSGEFTLWNGLTFNFETILQAHDSSVRCMVWSHNDTWMVTGDHAGYVKYWQSNMNNVKMFQGHKEAIRGISFCPTDTKFTTCSDDGTVRVWDFLRCFEEKILRGHGADVKCVDWHPQKSLIVSGSKDSQQPIKLWDPKSGQSLATVHAHKSTVMEVKWNRNGNWLLTASRDHLLKLFDIRKMNQELQTFRGHKKEACSLAWHPVHESLFASGGSDGSVMFWMAGADKEVGAMENAHDSCVWSLAWHPLGHILCSGSNDHTSKFWTRNRPGDRMRDKYNLNTLPRGLDDTGEYDEPATTPASAAPVIPGMGLEQGTMDMVRAIQDQQNQSAEDAVVDMNIPGLDFGSEEHANAERERHQHKRMPFAKPIPKQFQQQWMENKQPLLLAPPPDGVLPEGDAAANANAQAPPAGGVPNLNQPPPPMNMGGPPLPVGAPPQGNFMGPPPMGSNVGGANPGMPPPNMMFNFRGNSDNGSRPPAPVQFNPQGGGFPQQGPQGADGGGPHNNQFMGHPPQMMPMQNMQPQGGGEWRGMGENFNQQQQQQYGGQQQGENSAGKGFFQQQQQSGGFWRGGGRGGSPNKQGGGGMGGPNKGWYQGDNQPDHDGGGGMKRGWGSEGGEGSEGGMPEPKRGGWGGRGGRGWGFGGRGGRGGFGGRGGGGRGMGGFRGRGGRGGRGH